MSTGVTMGNVKGHYIAALNLTPTAVAATSNSTQAFTVHGTRVGDVVQIIPPSQVVGLAIAPTVVTVDRTVNIAFVNSTGGSVTPPAGAYTFLGFRPDNVVLVPSTFAD